MRPARRDVNQNRRAYAGDGTRACAHYQKKGRGSGAAREPRLTQWRPSGSFRPLGTSAPAADVYGEGTRIPRGLTMSRTLLPAIVAAAIAAPLLADSALFAQPPADTPRVARLVRDLGADSFAVRTQASEELAKLGATARREIELAIRSDDPEVRLRAKDLLRTIKVHELWGAGRFTCPNKPTPAAQLLRSLAEQTGNHVLVGDQFGTFQDSPVQFEFAAADYWPTIDELCRQTGNHCRPHYDSRMPGVVVVAGSCGPAAPGVHRSGARPHH